MVQAVASYLAEMRLARRTAALEKARRLPVTLMVPLGLLILPGFVLLFVGPVLLGSIAELAGSLPS
jgi:pilus assembly protein TadC